MSKKDQIIKEKQKIQELKRAEEQILKEKKRKEKSKLVIKNYLEAEKKKIEEAEMRKVIMEHKTEKVQQIQEIQRQEKAYYSRRVREEFEQNYQQIKWSEEEKRELSANVFIFDNN